MTNNHIPDSNKEGRDQYEVDIDRMVNEGLGGGRVTTQNGLIEDTTTDTLGAAASLLNDISCDNSDDQK